MQSHSFTHSHRVSEDIRTQAFTHSQGNTHYAMKRTAVTETLKRWYILRDEEIELMKHSLIHSLSFSFRWYSLFYTELLSWVDTVTRILTRSCTYAEEGTLTYAVTIVLIEEIVIHLQDDTHSESKTTEVTYTIPSWYIFQDEEIDLMRVMRHIFTHWLPFSFRCYSLFSAEPLPLWVETVTHTLTRWCTHPEEGALTYAVTIMLIEDMSPHAYRMFSSHAGRIAESIMLTTIHTHSSGHTFGSFSHFVQVEGTLTFGSFSHFLEV